MKIYITNRIVNRLISSNIDEFIIKLSKFLEQKRYGFFLRKSYITNDCYFDIKPDNINDTIIAVKSFLVDMTTGKLDYFLLPHGFINKRDEVSWQIEVKSDIIDNRIVIYNYLNYNDDENIHPYLTKEEYYDIKRVLRSKVYNNPNITQETINNVKRLVKCKAIRENLEQETRYFNSILNLLNLKTDYINR